MRKMLLIATVLLAVMGVISGCKKNTDKKPTCRVISLSDIADSTLDEFTYDAQGRISVTVSGHQIYTYEYGDNIVTITYLSAGLLISKTTAILNEAGLAVNVKQETTQTGVDWYNSFNEYDGDKLIRTTQTASDGRPATVTTWQWTDGNMTSSITGTDTTTYTYYTDKPTQEGDYLSLTQLVEGYEEIRSKNLFKSLGDQVFDYQFGPDGKITGFKGTSGGSPVYNFQLQYECR